MFYLLNLYVHFPFEILNHKSILRNTFAKSLASRRRSLQEGDGVEIEGEEATGPPPPPKPSKLGRDCSQGLSFFYKQIFFQFFSFSFSFSFSFLAKPEKSFYINLVENSF